MSRPKSPVKCNLTTADTTKYVGDVRRNVPIIVYKGKSDCGDENSNRLGDSNKVIELKSRQSSPIKPAIKCNFPDVTFVASTKYVDVRRNVPVLIYKAKSDSDDEKDSPPAEVSNKRSSDEDDATSRPSLKKQCTYQKPILKEFATLEELRQACLTDKDLPVQIDRRENTDQQDSDEEIEMMKNSNHTSLDGFDYKYYSDPSRARKDVFDPKWNFLLEANSYLSQPAKTCGDQKSKLKEKENFTVFPKRENAEIRMPHPKQKPTEPSVELQKLLGLPKRVPEIPKRVLRPISRNIPPPIPLRTKPVPSQLAVLEVAEQFSKISMSYAPVGKKSERTSQHKPLILPEIPKHMIATTQLKSPFFGEDKKENKSSNQLNVPIPKTIKQIQSNLRMEINIDDYVTSFEPIPYPELIEMCCGSFEGKIIAGGSPSNFLFQLRPLELGLMSEEMKYLSLL